MPLPASGYLGNAARTTAEFQAAIDDLVDWIRDHLTVTESTSYRVSIGVGAGETTPGNYSINIGWDAAKSDPGIDAIAIGRLSAPYGQGVGSIAIGALSGSADDVGEAFQPAYCVAIGYSSLTWNGSDGISGYNTAVGAYSEAGGNGGIQYAAAFGSYADATGNYSSAFGYQSGALGSSSSAFGYSSSAPTANSTALGADAGPTADTYDGWTCLGAGANVITADNQIQIGASGTTTYTYGAVQNRSDARDKADIRDTELGLDFINALRPVQFRWDMREDYRKDRTQKLSDVVKNGSKKRSRFHNGLIAQEVKGVCDSLGVDFAGLQHHQEAGGDDVYSIGYEELIAPLIKAVQQLSARVAELEAR